MSTGIVCGAAGLLTTVQDMGRFGYQRDGLSPAGAVDARSLQIANLLVGNDPSAAGLESTLLGPEISFEQSNIFAITGANMSPMLDGAAVEPYRAVVAPAGSVLRFSASAQGGCRGYIAFAGGLDIPQVLNSRATMLRGGIGGLEGRKLRPGDAIGFLSPRAVLPDLAARYIEPDRFNPEKAALRVVLGPQDDRFTQNGLDTFLSAIYTVTGQCDRMGCRLEGARIEHTTDANIISDGIAQGAVQVPGDGQPIILLSERQSTGGYTKIATVISVDLPKLAQCRPGAKIRFEAVEIERAQELYLAHRDALNELQKRFALPRVQNARTLRMKINGVEYQVEIEEY